MKLLPITLLVFIGFQTMGVQMPVLPLHLHGTLGAGTLVVGLVIGSQFIAALLSRSWAGNFADMRGPRLAVVLGLFLTSCSGLIYLASVPLASMPGASIWILALGRVLLAFGESLIATGSLGWAVGIVGAQNAGKVMAWIGIAMYAAYAIGAPVGIAVNSRWGFSGIALFVVLTPAAALAMAALVPGVPPSASGRTSFHKVLGSVWLPGTGLALSSVGFGLISAFIALLFAANAWRSPGLAFSAFGLAFIGARLLFGHLPDKVGGAKVALVSVVIEATGLLFIWAADAPMIAYLGAALTGFGYSLAFPGFGVEAVRRAPPQTRSLAMGAYVAFLDLALGVASPAAGLLAGAAGIGSVYLAGAAVVGSAALVAVALIRDKRPLNPRSSVIGSMPCRNED